MEFAFSVSLLLPSALPPDSFWPRLPSVAVSVLQVLSVTSPLAFFSRRSTKTAFPVSLTAKVNPPAGFQQSNPNLNLNHKFMSGEGGWQMAAFPQRRGEWGGWGGVDVAGLSPPSHRRECGESGESGVERQGQGDSCRTPRSCHLDGK